MSDPETVHRVTFRLEGRDCEVSEPFEFEAAADSFVAILDEMDCVTDVLKYEFVPDERPA